MNILCVAEIGAGKVKKSTLSTIAFAKQLGANFSLLVVGAGASQAAQELVAFGAAKILVADDPSMTFPICERIAPTDAAVGQGFDVVVFCASAAGKDIAPRVATKLGAGYATDIAAVKAEGAALHFKRPMWRRPLHGFEASAWRWPWPCVAVSG